MLELDTVQKRYGAVAALDGCSLTVGHGEMVGLLGPNGAGKTTAMRTIFDLVVPDGGTVRWNGAPVTAVTRRRFGYMPEERGLYPRMRVRDQVAYFSRLHGLPRAAARRAADRWMARLGLAARADSRLETLSHGNQQRAQLAVALAHEPELLVLDEPFSGLDPLGVAAMAEVLGERAAAGAAVLFSSHQLDLVEDLCERVVVLDRGRVVLEGRVADLRASSPRRYLEATVVGGGRWWEALPEATPVRTEGDRVRLAVTASLDLGTAAAAARRRGRLVTFRFEPPTLSELFREAVGR